MKKLTLVAVLAALALFTVSCVDNTKPAPVKKLKKVIDKETGLIVAEGFEEVKANCTVCHSAKFITLQRGDKDTWTAMIRWMQKTQGLWELGENDEKIISYLAKNYPPGKASRRANLPLKYLPKK
ncbi:MAG: cytochrome C [Campylobacterales bacterium]|nr:cytochrome C [Campylobacterales bacterium]